MPSQKDINSTTQQFLDIYDITNNLVILKDGTASLIITVDAMNFGLLAEEEQDSIMYAYAGLLNSLNYPIQIIIKSQTKDVTGYLRLLKEQEDATLDRTQQKRIAKYREFVSNLIRERNVLDKKFYITIPAKPLELGLVPTASVLPGKGDTDISTVDKAMVLEKARNILEPKRDHLIAQFARIGLYSRQLETQEIIQLFYQSYNPEAFEGQSMDDSKNYTAPLVSASIEDSPMNMADTQQPVAQAATPTQPVTNTPPAPAVETQPIPTENTEPTPIPNPQTQPAVQSETPTQPTTQPAVQSIPTPPQTQTTTQAEPTSQGGYTPTQMESSAPAVETQTVPAENTSPAPTPQTQPTAQSATQAPQASQEVSATMPQKTETNTVAVNPENKKLPPAPELPNIQPGQVDSTIQQETEIKIQHPGTDQNQDPVAVTPAVSQAPATNEVAATPPQQNGELPPLPEIQ